MAQTLEGVLARIPGAAGYLAKTQFNQQQEAGELARLAQVVGMQGRMADQQAQAVERARMEQYRQAVAGLGEAPTQEQLAQVAARFGGPEAVMRAQQSSLDRQAASQAAQAAAAERTAAARAASEQRAADAQAARDQRMEEIKLRLADQATARQERAELMREMTALRQAATATKPPPGYRPTPQGNLEAIPGGPADTKIQGAMNQDTITLNTTTAGLDRLAMAANEVMRSPGLAKITGIQGVFPNMPGGSAANANAKLETLKAQVGFGVLQEMRNASKSGGALGSITERELAFLQNALASLDRAQSEDEIKQSLQKIIEYAAGAKIRLQQGFNMKYQNRQPTDAAPQQPGVVDFGSLK